MKKIIIYSSSICPYCVSAKRLLENLNLNFEEKSIDHDIKLKEEMLKKSNGRITVPQIFFGEIHIGGYDDLERIYKTGNLMSLLNEN